MAFNPKMFKQKKKREVDPNAPPRPNLMSHDKKLREQTESVTRLTEIVRRQEEIIARLEAKYRDMQQSISQLINYVRRDK